MRNMVAVSMLAITFFMMAEQPVLAEDERLLIKVDETVKGELLKEMRELTERLDDVLAALSEGNFKEVARISEIHLGFGHKKLEAMLAAGASMDDIRARKTRMKANRKAREESGVSNHRKGSMFGIPGEPDGLGHKLPEDFWLMGQSMHGAAEAMAIAAKNATSKPAGEMPTPADYKAVLGNLQEMTSTCRGCHDAYRVH